MRAAGSAAGSSAGVAGFRGVVPGVLGGLAVLVAVLGFSPSAYAQTCPNAAVRAQQGAVVEGLPDCMALEQVSPRFKDSHPARILNRDPIEGVLQFGSISPGGDRVLFRSTGALGGTPGSMDFAGDVYIASRDPGGQEWVTDYTTPPNGITVGWIAKLIPQAFTADLGQWFQLGDEREQWEVGLNRAFRGGLGGSIEQISPLLTHLSGEPGHPFGGVQIVSRGSSADGSRFYFAPASTNSSITFLPADPKDPAAPHTYVAGLDSNGDPSLRLLARDRDGKVWGGRCGAAVGGNSSQERNVGAISADGSRTYFTTRPGQLFDSEAGEGPVCSSANGSRIMVREEMTSGPVVEELFPSPPGVGDDVFQGASIDGGRVYFTTPRSLVAADVDATVDLYLYDADRPVGEELKVISGPGSASPSVTAISSDGSHVYFNSGEVLTADPGPGGQVAQVGANNLYVFERGPEHPGDRVAFIAVTEAGSAYPVPVLGPDPSVLGVGGDGHRLLFTSTASLDAADTDDGLRDVFRYDADDQSLVRLSKAAPGGNENGVAVGVVAGLQLGGDDSLIVHENGPDYVGRGRWVSEDGETVAFKSVDGLVSADGNGIMDSYVSRGGELFRLPGTADSANEQGLVDALRDRPLVSFDGDTVVFQTFEPLLSRDVDSTIDVYAVRVGGGFLEPPPPPPACVVLADVCQGGGAAPTPVAPQTSASGSANATPGARTALALRMPALSQRRRAARSGVLSLRVRTNKAGVVRLRARARVGRKTRRVASASMRFSKPGVARVDLRLSALAKRTLGKGRGLALAIEVRQAGARARTVTVTLKRSKRS